MPGVDQGRDHLVREAAQGKQGDGGVRVRGEADAARADHAEGADHHTRETRIQHRHLEVFHEEGAEIATENAPISAARNGSQANSAISLMFTRPRLRDTEGAVVWVFRYLQQSPLPFRLDEDQASYCSLDQRNPCWAAAGTTGADLDRGRKDSRLANDRAQRKFVAFHDPA